MYCPSCGKPVDASGRFCSNCGAQIGSAGAAVPPNGMGTPMPQLMRPRFPRMIGGVCSAFAIQYGWDLSLVRIITAMIAILTSGVGGLAYLAAWVIIPEAPYELPGAPGAPFGTTGNPAV